MGRSIRSEFTTWVLAASRALLLFPSLPPDLAEHAERVAKEEGKSLSAVIQDALRLSRRQRLSGEWKEMQGYWSARAREKGLLKEGDLDRFLRRR